MTEHAMTTRAAAPLTDAIAAHHAEMETELRQRVDDLITVVARGEPHEEATGRVVDYALSTLLPHAASEEVSLYAAAAPFEARLVRSLIGEHDALRRLVSQLAAGREATASAAAASAIAELFALHAAKENAYIVPALLEHVPTQILALMRRMHEEFERGSHPRVGATLDVRHIPHAARHGRISRLSPG
jgi:sugar phosphate isomerase/epimerase